MSDSDDDWFKKDENELLQNLEQQVKQQVASETKEEHIEFYIRADHNRVECSLESSDASNASGRFNICEFANALKMTPLEMFLYFMTENRDLFKDQLPAKYSQRRVSLYVQILTVLGQLELGGFNEELLAAFAKQTVLLCHVKNFADRLFEPPSKGNLDEISELLLRNIKWLLIRAHKLGVLEETGYELIEHFKMLLARSQLPELLKQPVCIEFAQELAVLPTVQLHVKHEIYPKLDDLRGSETNAVMSLPAAAGDVAGYINLQRQLLCEAFLHPLREFVQRLRAQSYVDPQMEQNLFLPHAELILNPQFSEAQRHSLIFMDFIPTERKDKVKCYKFSPLQRELLKNIKTGTLLCFTSSYDFDNLILATVGYTETEMRKQGYLSVEIAKQYNVGNIYGKPLIMFEAPVFFEPYLRVHNYLSTCSADNFPMRRYIIEGQLEIHPPAYIRPDAQLTYNGVKFMAADPPKKTQLNDMQRTALGAALSNEFCLIQGPPGTGKTHLSIELVNTLLQNADHLKLGPIIVLTYSNESLDKFLLKAAKHTDSILRFGYQTRQPEIERFNVRTKIDEELVPHRLKRLWWLVKCEYKEQFERLQTLHSSFDGSEESYVAILSGQEQLNLIAEKINTLRNIFQYYVARDKSLLGMTTSCAARLNFLFRLLQSKCFIFEEAAETPEAHVLACLTPYTQHVILIGDHKQLQPHTGRHHMQQGLQISLFERLITNQFPATVLNVQYRMRKCIAELLVPIFYDELSSDNSVLEYPDVPNMTSNMYFVNHKHPEEQLSDMSFVNKHEAVELINLLLYLKAKPSDIVILSPYNAQVEYIKSILPSRRLYCVASVDSYQGLEADIVLLSLVRSNSAGQIGFLRQLNRVCVALSRARCALYMIGNMETLQRGNQQLWGAINSKLQAANAIGTAFPCITVPKKVVKMSKK
ncbi:NFX1-type zinc finger-containing protein 1 [Drosophila grimshawi]|uniref:GH18666 n=1 Tax=Drosophila grimshawi TaxID=7222 RepID=B4JH40_DROGR|nr:NFX1-type zinc finger-containing protein 1 [Drosophila grimshawi]EDV92731.1 GH18666 [Drosophila grimshawi]